MTDHQSIHSSVSNEWFTPATYIEAARQVMGSIDLDPASCLEANQIVDAHEFYTEETNGLIRVWHGNVFLNPPYGKVPTTVSVNKKGMITTKVVQKSNQAIWTEKLLTEWYAHRIKSAILLVNAVPDREWFQPLWDDDRPICFTSSRIKFIAAGSGKKNQPTHGNAFVYFGPRENMFVERFYQFGVIARKVR